MTNKNTKSTTRKVKSATTTKQPRLKNGRFAAKTTKKATTAKKTVAKKAAVKKAVKKTSKK